MIVAGHRGAGWMRRVWLGSTLAAGIVLVPTAGSWAAPTPTPPPQVALTSKIPLPTAVAPSTVCTISSSRSHGAIDITGLVATKSGYIAIDGTASGRGTSIYTFDSSCARTHIEYYSGRGADDPEDLAIDKNGTLWVADIGDVDASRSTVVLWKVPSSGSVTLYRFKYADGAHDASAMVLDGDGRPIFITRNGSGPAALYEPAAGALQTGSTTPLTKVGTFTPEQTGTATKYSILGQTWVTGGANSPDGTKVVLRTGSDAYEWTVKGGAVVAAITTGTPTITPMPQPSSDPDFDGESIAYTSDGSGFLAISKTAFATPLLRFTPATPITKSSGGVKGAVKGPKKPSAVRAWVYGLSLTDLNLILGGVAVFGLILVLIGVFGIRSSRQKFRLAAAGNRPIRPDLTPAGVNGRVYRVSVGRTGRTGGGVYGTSAATPGANGAAVGGVGAGGHERSGANSASREAAYDENGYGPDHPTPHPYGTAAVRAHSGGRHR